MSSQAGGVQRIADVVVRACCLLTFSFVWHVVEKDVQAELFEILLKKGEPPLHFSSLILAWPSSSVAYGCVIGGGSYDYVGCEIVCSVNEYSWCQLQACVVIAVVDWERDVAVATDVELLVGDAGVDKWEVEVDG